MAPRSTAVVLMAMLVASVHSSALTSAGQAHERALEEAWSRELEDGPKQYKSPIARVIGLITDMKKELEAEAANEEAMYDKMVCWCETNEKEKTLAVATAETTIDELVGTVESSSAFLGKVQTEIAALKEQIAEDTSALEKATAIREKEAAEFSAYEKDMIQSLTNLKNAVAVLGRHHSSLLQVDSPMLASLSEVLSDVAQKYDLLVAGAPKGGFASHSKSVRKGASLLAIDSNAVGITSASKQLLAALDSLTGGVDNVMPLDIAQHKLADETKKSSSAFLQAQKTPGDFKSYSSQSDGIFGIMKQMEEEFEGDLSAAQKEEKASIGTYEALAASKTNQIAVGKEKLDVIEGENAANIKALSDANEDLDLTREQRSADIEFLRNLKTTCMDLDQQYAERSKTRGEELAAVAEALKILTDDDAKELMRKTVTFLQVNVDSDASMKIRRSKAAATLRHAAHQPVFDTDDLLASWHSRTGSPSALGGGAKAQLATLAVSVELDQFTKVKEMMDKMVADLKVQQEEEVKHKANCEKEFDENEKSTYKKTEEKEDLEAEIDSLAKLIEKLTAEIKAAKADVAATELAITKASQTREEENTEFQTTVADQRATQAILKKAYDRLQSFYKEKGGNLLQVKTAKAVQEPPVKFNEYKTNTGASPVIGLIEQIITDSKTLEAEAVKAETDAQAAYEKFVKDSNTLIADLTKQITTKTKAVAQAELDTEENKGSLAAAKSELESLSEYKGDLHMDCDFVLKNFEIRQAARLQEMEAINSAKGILSGAA